MPAPQHGPRMPDHHGAGAAYRAGLAALDQKQYSRAIELLSTVLQRGGVPATLARYYLAQAQRHAGMAAARQGQYESAVRHLREAQRLSPESRSLADQLARCYAQLGEMEPAISVLDARLTARGENPPSGTVVRLALLQWRTGRHAEAIATLTRAMADRPNEHAFPLQLGLLHAEKCEYASALPNLTKAAELAPRNGTVHHYLALVLAALGRMPESAAALRRAEQCRNTQPGGTRRVDSTLSITPASRRLMAKPHGDSSSINPMDAATMPAPVCESLAAVVAREPELIESFLDLPETPVDGDVFRVLRDAVRLAMARHPNYADLHHYAARVSERLGDWSSALSETDEAVRINPRFTQAWIHGGRLMVRQQRYDDARTRFEQALSHGADYPDVHFELGQLHRRAGDRERARRSYGRALELNDRYAAAKEALATLKV